MYNTTVLPGSLQPRFNKQLPEEMKLLIVDTTRICQCIQEFGHPEMNQRYRLIKMNM